MAVPNLCFDDSSTPSSVVATRGSPPFFVFASITVDCFWETQSTNSRKVSWRVFSKRQSGPASYRIPDRPNVNFNRSRMVLRQECCGNHYLSEFRKETGRQEEKHKKANINARAREKKASWHGYIPRHAGCRMTMRLTQNNSVTTMQTMQRNPLMQNHTILIQRDQALSLCLSVIDEAKGTLSEWSHVQYLSGNWWTGTSFRNKNGVRRQKKISNFSCFCSVNIYFQSVVRWSSKQQSASFRYTR